MRRMLVAVAVTLCVPVLPAAEGADAASITQVGWWSQRPGAGELPEGGFELALSFNDALSQAALRVDVSAVQLTFALLELTPTDEFGAEAAAIRACPTSDAWAPANPGAWDDRPAPDCDAKNVLLSRRQTGEWSADVAELLNVGTNSIVLVPASHPDTQGAPVPYQLVFESARLISDAPSPPPTASTGGGRQPASPARPSIIAAPRSPPTAQFPAAPPIVVEPSDSPVPAYDLPRQAAPLASNGPGEMRPWWRLVLLVPLSTAVGVGAVVARRFVLERGLTRT